MTLRADAVEREATAFLQALSSATPLEPPRERLPGLTVADAYAIQRRTIALRERAGARRIGRKVGLTSVAMQELLGVHEPDYGVLLDDMVVAARDGIDVSRLIAPRAEPEIAFFLGRELAGDVAVEDVIAATESVCAAIEIVDSRVVDWRIGIEDTVADNASSALVVLGERRPIAGVDLVGEQVTFAVGGAVETGRGDAVLGHPAAAVAWLARALATYGDSLLPGDIVLPGAMTKALPLTAGARVRATFQALGEVAVDIR